MNLNTKEKNFKLSFQYRIVCNQQCKKQLYKCIVFIYTVIKYSILNEVTRAEMFASKNVMQHFMNHNLNFVIQLYIKETQSRT